LSDPTDGVEFLVLQDVVSVPESFIIEDLFLDESRLRWDPDKCLVKDPTAELRSFMV